ncbi:class I SAM-dependent methyltransferase [Litoricola sp.]|nr:class I SAM-dependent methyltransferase [Litorivicinus sp.]
MTVHFWSFFSKSGWDCYGIDPSAGKFSENYDLKGLQLQVGFFPEEMPALWSGVEFDLVSAIAMFYDLPDPIRFLESIKNILAPDGKIVIDVGFVPTMISNYALDSICHEHLSYYSTAQLLLAFNEAGLRIADSWLSDMNGGTVSVVLEKRKDSEPHNLSKNLLSLTSRYEKECRAEWLSCIEYMKRKAKETKSLLDSLAQSGKRIAALGASTKGNTMLQMFDFGQEHFVAIGEVNPEKFGKVTPGTAIPIVSESQLLQEGVEVFLVLPWHFRDFFQAASHLDDRILIFMLPELFVRWPVAKESN